MWGQNLAPSTPGLSPHQVWGMLSYNHIGYWGCSRGGLQDASCPAQMHAARGSPLPALLADELTCSARLTVQPSVQPLFTRKLEDVDVVEGRTARFDCMISGTPPPAVTWTHFGNPQAQRACPGPCRETSPHPFGDCTQGLEPSQGWEGC